MYPENQANERLQGLSGRTKRQAKRERPHQAGSFQIQPLEKPNTDCEKMKQIVKHHITLWLLIKY